MFHVKVPQGQHARGFVIFALLGLRWGLNMIGRFHLKTCLVDWDTSHNCGLELPTYNFERFAIIREVLHRVLPYRLVAQFSSRCLKEFCGLSMGGNRGGQLELLEGLN